MSIENLLQNGDFNLTNGPIWAIIYLVKERNTNWTAAMKTEHERCYRVLISSVTVRIPGPPESWATWFEVSDGRDTWGPFPRYAEAAEVRDSVAGYYTACHSLSQSAQRRARKLADRS